MSDDIKILHVHGPEAWHEPAFVVGNRQGLEALRDAIDEALKQAEPGQKGFGTQECMTNDGEGFFVHATCIDEDWQHPDWVDIGVPYSADVAKENRENAKMPWDLRLKGAIGSVG